MNPHLIETLASSLSDEERERFSELIDECLERERTFAETDMEVRRDLEELTRAAIGLINSLETLEKTLDFLKKALTLNDTSRDQVSKRRPPGFNLH